MAETANVEVVISAFTEVAQEAIEEVGDRFGNLAADAQPAQSAVNEVGDELNNVAADSAIASQAVNEVGDEASTAAVKHGALAGQVERAGDKMTTTAGQASILGGAYTRLSGSVGGVTFSMGIMNTMMTASLIPSLLTLSTVLVPLVTALGVLTGGALALAGAFGTVVAAGAVTHFEELKQAIQDVKDPILEAIRPLGEVFGPMMVDAIELLPVLVRQIVEAIGPLDTFADELAALGAQAMDVLPGLIGAMFDFAEVALPAFRNLIDFLANDGPSAASAMWDSFQTLIPAFRDLLDSTLDLLPTLLDFGTVVAAQVLPALADIFDVVGRVMDFVLNLDPAFRDLAIAGTILAPAIFGVAGALGTLLGPIGIVAGVVTAFAAAYRSNFMGVRDVTDRVVGDVVDWLKGFQDEARNLRDNATGWFQDLRDVVTETLEAMTEPFEDLAANVQGLGEDVAALVGDMVAAMMPLASRVVQVLKDNQGAFKSLGRTVIRAVDGVVGVIRGLVPVIRFVFENVTMPLLDMLVGLFEQHFGTIVSEVNQTLNALMGYFQTFGEAAGGFWEKWGDEITTVVQIVVDVLKGVLGTAIDGLVTTILILMDVLQGDFGDALKKAKGFLMRTFGDVVGFVQKWGSTFLDVVTTAISYVIGIMDSASNTIYNVFADLFNGLISLAVRGFQNLVNTVVDAMNQFISVVNAAIEEANKVPGFDQEKLGKLDQVDLNERALQVQKRETDVGTLAGRRKDQLEVVIDFTTGGEGPLADFVDQRAEVKVQQGERSSQRKVRRQNAKPGGAQ